jgi:curli biogenesis system outer membrane secretion channel CsgG
VLLPAVSQAAQYQLTESGLSRLKNIFQQLQRQNNNQLLGGISIKNKKRLLFLILAIAVFTFTNFGLVDAAPKRIGVIAFENASTVEDAAFGRGMADMLVSELTQNRNFIVVERSQLERVLREQFRGATMASEMGNAM